MKVNRLLYGVGCLALAWAPVRAADPMDCFFVSNQPGATVAPAQMPTGPQSPQSATRPDLGQDAQNRVGSDQTQANANNNNFSQAPPAGGEAAASANPQMVGDSLSYTMGGAIRPRRATSVPGIGALPAGSFIQTIPQGTLVYTPVRGAIKEVTLIPNAGSNLTFDQIEAIEAIAEQGIGGDLGPSTVRSLGGSSFKTSDNESPRPECRAFLSVDYFTRVLHSVRDQLYSGTAPQLRLARQVFGYEKTFLDGDASLEVRIPFFQAHDDAGASLNDMGDITILSKWALLNEHEEDADRVFTVGVALTLPTGPNDVVLGTSINPFIVQPYVGYLLGNRNFFVQGFSELAIPLSDSVPTVWFNDIGLDYYAYRGEGCVSALVPTVEGHLTTPFGKQGSDARPVGVIDTAILTAGLHIVFAKHALLTFAYEFPVTGPQPFESEYVMQFNYRF